MSHHEILVREAAVGDIPEILRQRRGMFVDMGLDNAEDLAAMLSTSATYFSDALRQGRFRGWLAVTPAAEVAGGGGVVITEWPTHPSDPQPRRATILNLYTYPQHRRKGIARRLILTMIEWCRGEGFASVSLHASDDGRRLYESLGFEPTNEMRLRIR
jgi:GNAT superfamily N-acetyltransferase